jgi:tetratricopeptide (TPR) repeat protein
VQKGLTDIICAALILFFLSPGYSEILNSTRFYNEGVERFKEGDNEKALELFLKAAEINDSYTLAHYGIGRVYLQQQNRTEDAVKHLKKAVQLDSSFAKGFFYLGMAQMLAGKYNDSIKSFKKAYEKDIALQESLYNISVAYDMKGDKLNSIIYYKKYIKAKEKKDDDIF